MKKKRERDVGGQYQEGGPETSLIEWEDSQRVWICCTEKNFSILLLIEYAYSWSECEDQTGEAMAKKASDETKIYGSVQISLRFTAQNPWKNGVLRTR